MSKVHTMNRETFVYRGPNDYVNLIENVRFYGALASPRGEDTYEVTDVTIRIPSENVIDAIPFGIGRGLNPRIGAAETAQLIAGISDAEQLSLASGGNFDAFMESGQLLGAYGPRLQPQLLGIISLLERDPDTRQAVAPIWCQDELKKPSKDVPCTVALSWRIRDGKLHMNTHMRSNDLWLGVPYDLWMFTRLHQSMALALSLPIGDYTHFVNSLHLYSRDIAKLGKLHTREPGCVNKYSTYYPFVISSKVTKPVDRMKAIRLGARLAMDGILDGPVLNTYAVELNPISNPKSLCGACHYTFGEFSNMNCRCDLV